MYYNDGKLIQADRFNTHHKYLTWNFIFMSGFWGVFDHHHILCYFESSILWTCFLIIPKKWQNQCLEKKPKLQISVWVRFTQLRMLPYVEIRLKNPFLWEKTLKRASYEPIVSIRGVVLLWLLHILWTYWHILNQRSPIRDGLGTFHG